ncbi:hypothetical protein [Thermococcus sp. JCM 11816]|uniref:amino acid kinase family protein n=1 Tax=Thermococcus sp. (strain JCM 11816 / KS-1) TaxID=1295125 RepID=UPI003465050F
MPGFVGSYNGLRTTLGREGGSDYTAAVLGKGLKARAVLIMSGVDGIYTADPRRVVSARLIPFVSYDELYVASKAGMKAIHHGAIDVVRGYPNNLRQNEGLEYRNNSGLRVVQPADPGPQGSRRGGGYNRCRSCGSSRL